MPEEPNEEDLRKWHRWFAVECNNDAWRLSEAASRSAAEDAEMLNAAHAAAFHWNQVGTELNVALAETLLGHVHALLGHGELAMRYAQSSFDFVTLRDSPDWEVAFAHAILAHAAFAAGDGDTHARHYALAKETAERLGDEDRNIFDATFRQVPIPGGAGQPSP
jgi:hypothetical protein